MLLTFDNKYDGSKYIAVSSHVLFPREPFGIWVYIDTPQDENLTTRYGIDFQDMEHHMSLRFGIQDHIERLGENRVLIERRVPKRTWTYQQIDLAEAFTQAGWKMPSFQGTTFNRVNADFRTVEISLFMEADGAQEDVRVYFGPIIQDGYRVKTTILMAETLDDPRGYYVRLAEAYEIERNYPRALSALERALEYSPFDPFILRWIEDINAHLGKERPR